MERGGSLNKCHSVFYDIEPSTLNIVKDPSDSTAIREYIYHHLSAYNKENGKIELSSYNQEVSYIPKQISEAMILK
jgi:hypothetical protein